MTQKNKIIRQANNRDAVETAIDVSKGKKSKTWEAIASETRTRISQWDHLARKELTEPNTTC